MIVPVPVHWPPRYNACTAPCDAIHGPCACGAAHRLDESWVVPRLEAYGLGELTEGLARPTPERKLVAENLKLALKREGGDKRAAAAAVGISLKTVYNRLEKWPEMRS